MEFLTEFVDQFREKRKEFKKATDEYEAGQASIAEMKERKKPLEKKYRENLEVEKHFVELQSRICKL